MLLLENREKCFVLKYFDILKFSNRDSAYKFVWSLWNSSDR